ncbi:hypothetical protein CYLTODRAFT_416388 [Cylindrobasidium torrendii FP15055 ss-10]|uniref:RING-type E3 ubiquitin transferase n=1 Tax=Cylindrobasidium torrendii FP15055 ss-10 TaxID=1314674 RepID=A0A0D7BVB3_9AGAR|nr:hypothetical protein CYLTODRAFT_416388 [Cylindrobasidium torrendii FP15055 ss-10]
MSRITPGQPSDAVPIPQAVSTQAHAEKHPHPWSSQLCWGWEHDWCPEGWQCQFVHGDLQYDSPLPEPARLPELDEARNSDESISLASDSDATKVEEPPPPKVRHPRPRLNEVCRKARRKQCPWGYKCHRIHENLEYDDPVDVCSPDNETVALQNDKPPSPSPSPIPVEPRPIPKPEWSVTIHEHIRLKLDHGFIIQDIQTGFETAWLYIDGLPPTIRESTILTLLTPHGPAEIKSVSRRDGSALARALFEDHVDARNAAVSLDGTKQFGGRTIHACLSLTPEASGGNVRDTTVVIEWDAPSVTAYGGFRTLEQAQTAVASTRLPFRERNVRAAIFEGMPQVGMYTVKYWNLPVEVYQDKDALEELGAPRDLMWDLLTYKSDKEAIALVRRILGYQFDVKEWEPVEGPYMDGIIQVYASFESPAVAKQAAEHMHLRKPAAIKGLKLRARHLKNLVFRVNSRVFTRIRGDLCDLRDALTSKDDKLVIVPRTGDYQIRLTSTDMKQLGKMKKDFDAVLRGDTVVMDGKAAWDKFFEYPAGIIWAKDLRRQYPSLDFYFNVPLRRITLRGPVHLRAKAKEDIIFQIKKLRSRTCTTINIPGDLVAHFVAKQFPRLREELGAANIHMDLWTRTLVVHGSAHMASTARNAVQAVRAVRRPSSTTRSSCPICFEDVQTPVLFRCGHAHCRGCLREYLQAATEARFFPLTCLGGGGQCTEAFPLGCAKDILTQGEFEGVVHAAFSAHVAAKPKEWHHCPTPDCPQVFRTAPPGTMLQCPECLTRICAACCGESHDGEPCAEDDSDDEQAFRKWKDSAGVQACPGCNVDIERSEGCNHVTCIRCNTHICWECLATFPRGEGIYDHMRSQHGSIGLIPFF